MFPRSMGRRSDTRRQSKGLVTAQVTTMGNWCLISWGAGGALGDMQTRMSELSLPGWGVREPGRLYTNSCQSLAEGCSREDPGSWTPLPHPTHRQKGPSGRETLGWESTGEPARRGVGGHCQRLFCWHTESPNMLTWTLPKQVRPPAPSLAPSRAYKLYVG